MRSCHVLLSRLDDEMKPCLCASLGAPLLRRHLRLRVDAAQGGRCGISTTQPQRIDPIPAHRPCQQNLLNHRTPAPACHRSAAPHRTPSRMHAGSSSPGVPRRARRVTIASSRHPGRGPRRTAALAPLLLLAFTAATARPLAQPLHRAPAANSAGPTLAADLEFPPVTTRTLLHGCHRKSCAPPPFPPCCTHPRPLRPAHAHACTPARGVYAIRGRV